MSENISRKIESNDCNLTKTEIELKAVINGEVIRTEDIEDLIFSNKMIGDGYGIIPTGKKLYSPVSGKVEEIAFTKHAIYLSVEDHFKILIHIGVNTIELKGKGFETKIESGMFVNKGDLLVSFDPDFIRKEGLNPVVSVIILDQKDKKIDFSVYPEKEAIANESLALKAIIY